MSKTLTSTIQSQLTKQDVKIKFILKIEDIDFSNYLMNWSIDFSKEFGSAQASFVLDNNDNIFGEEGSNKINVGDVVAFSEYFGGDSTEFKKFYGLVQQRSISKTSQDRNITLICLDYISTLQFLDIDLTVEGTKVQIENEILIPNYLSAPNDSLAQVFNFANDSIAQNPPPSIIIKNKDTNAEDPQYDGYDMLYDNGQLKLGFPLNAKDNYDLMASSYFHYTKGVYIEDVLKEILLEPDGYCYSSDTEVMTENGWMLLKDIVDNKLKIKVATLNSQKDVVEYHYPEEYIKQQYSGLMLHQEGRRIDFKVTPNHNVWAKQISSWTNYDYKFYKASELPQHVIYKKDFPYEGIEKEYFILPEYNSSFLKINYKTNKKNIYNINKSQLKIKMDSWLEFFGIYLAEGWIKEQNTVKISQNPTWKKDIIEKWIKNCGFKYNYNEKYKEFTICNIQLAQYLIQFGKSHDKFIPRELLSLSKRQLNILLNALCLGDGTIKNCDMNNYSFSLYNTVSKKLANNVQELSLKCGYSSNLIEEECIYRISLATRKETMPNQGEDNRVWELYNDFIYCLNVPNHLMYVGRKGKGCWNGNSYYLFEEGSAQDVIDNHLTDTFLNVEGTTIDYLIPNYTASTITIYTTLSVAVVAGDTSINVVSTDGFPTVGEGNINGDVFTWNGKTANTLTGIPSTGSYSLKTHTLESYVKYEHQYAIGEVWYFKYSNLFSTLTANDFTIPLGTFNYLDKRMGRIILTSPISLSSIVTCNTNYAFSTLQASGIEINYISFKSREIENRFEAIKKLREYCAPNFVIRTRGDNKIWASYLSQRTVEDYTLELIAGINYLEDDDLYTRVIFRGKNKNPTNLMLGGDVDFIGTGQSYKALASNTELSLLSEEGNYWVYGSLVSEVGKITTNTIKPEVYINGVAIDNKSHSIAAQQVAIEITTRSETTSSSGGK